MVAAALHLLAATLATITTPSRLAMPSPPPLAGACVTSASMLADGKPLVSGVRYHLRLVRTAI